MKWKANQINYNNLATIRFHNASFVVQNGSEWYELISLDGIINNSRIAWYSLKCQVYQQN